MNMSVCYVIFSLLATSVYKQINLMAVLMKSANGLMTLESC